MVIIIEKANDICYPSEYHSNEFVIEREICVQLNEYRTEDETLNNMWKIKLIKNMKTPLESYKSNFEDNKKNKIIRYKTNKIFKCIENYNDNYNIGILTGRINNIMVVDIDFKKPGELAQDGMELFTNEYINIVGMPNTRTIKTISGGFHFMFNYIHSDDMINKLMKNI